MNTLSLPRGAPMMERTLGRGLSPRNSHNRRAMTLLPRHEGQGGSRGSSRGSSGRHEHAEGGGGRVGGSRALLAFLVVFLFEGCVYNMVFLGKVLPLRDRRHEIPAFLLTFNVLWSFALWSYLQAHSSDPGRIPPQWQDFVNSVGELLPVAPSRLEWQPGKATYCRECCVLRPERAHHCMVCGFCVMRMDHHCPWLGNCVGFGNHKFFFLTLGYSVLLSLFGLGSAGQELFHCLLSAMGHEVHSGDWDDRILEKSEQFCFLIFGAVALCFSMGLSVVLFIHLSMAVDNSTSIEDNYDNIPNPFKQKGAMLNLATIFGAPGMDWVFPIAPVRPTSDGVSFQKNNEERLHSFDESLWPESTDTWRLRYDVRDAQWERAASGSGFCFHESSSLSRESSEPKRQQAYPPKITIVNGRRTISL